jgi:hypothetical protein
MDGLHFLSPKPNLSPPERISVSDSMVTARLAVSPRLAAEAYRIRYDAYHSSGHLVTGDQPIFKDKYDDQSNFRTALVFKGDTPAATLRIGEYRPPTTDAPGRKLPAMEIFGQEIDAVLAGFATDFAAPRAVEIGRLARSPIFIKDTAILFALFRVAGYLILNYDADIVFNAVRAHHVPMYRRFGFQALEEPRLYPGLTCKMALMACFRPSYAAARDHLPFLRGIATTDAAYAGLIAGERVRIFGDDAPAIKPARPADAAVPPLQRPVELRRSA